ncbi:MAG: methyl-accepting chemotaxis protein [Tepidimonas sp.]|nr:methyl-accepting chemotaxis protein [Tepidimonas sp.]
MTFSSLVTGAQRDAPAGSESCRRSLFQRHGPWAPAVELMRRLRFAGKSLVISACFLAPLVLLAVLWVRTAWHDVALAEREAVGAQYLRQLLPVLRLAQQQRVLADMDVLGMEEARTLRSRIGDELRQALAHWEALDRQVAAQLATDALRQQLIQGVQEQLQEGQGAPTASAVSAVLRLWEHVAETSGLLLDPEPRTYYLMATVVSDMPDALVAVSQSRRLAAFQLRSANEETARRLSDQLARLDVSLDRAARSWAQFQRASGQASTPQPVAELTQAKGLVRHGREEILADLATDDPATYFRSHDATVDGLFAFVDQGLGQLQALTLQRAHALRQAILMAGCVVVVSMVAALYLFVGFYRVNRGGLHVVACHLERMAQGDLHEAPPPPWGRDEPADLIQHLRRAYDSLRALILEVGQASNELVQVAADVGAGAQQLRERTQATAANLEQQAAAMEEIMTTLESGLERVAASSEQAARNAQLASEGGQVVGEVVQTMQAIRESSGRIGAITHTIESIAFQTNILALNAAVEAARAGEAGRGFAVVAAEVRALAQRSAEAAKAINSLIAETLQRVAAGADIVERAGQTMQRIVAASEGVQVRLREIEAGAREQAQGIEQAGRAVQEIEQRTQEDTTLVEQSVAFSDRLAEQASRLRELMGRFRLPPSLVLADSPRLLPMVAVGYASGPSQPA